MRFQLFPLYPSFRFCARQGFWRFVFRGCLSQLQCFHRVGVTEFRVMNMFGMFWSWCWPECVKTSSMSGYFWEALVSGAILMSSGLVPAMQAMVTNVSPLLFFHLFELLISWEVWRLLFWCPRRALDDLSCGVRGSFL